MTLQDYQRLLGSVTYKPGWQLALRPAAAGFVHLEIQAPVADSWPPHQGISISISYAFNERDFPNPGTFYSFVRASVQRTEQHEVNEWFRIEGRAWPTDDHATF